MLEPADIELIAQVPIFAALPPESMQRLAQLARRVDVAAATIIFREGELAKEMVVVLSGELEVRKLGRDGGEARIATLKPGDVAGEMALIDIQPRSAAVLSLGPASLMVLTHGDLAELHRLDADAYTLLIMNIAREISRRLRRVDGLLANLLVEVHDAWSEIDASTSVGMVRRKA